MNARIIVRPVRQDDEAEWRGLWRQYLDFYEETLPDRVTDHTWRKLAAGERMRGLAAAAGERLIAFAIVVLHDATWSTGLTAYLEDLYVSPEYRRVGAAGELIREIISHARSHGWTTLYWHTAASNQPARRVYDRFCNADDYVRYRIRIG